MSDSLPDGLAPLTSNEYLVLAGTLHGIHAITSRLSPMGSSSGVQVIEAETFKLNILLTVTGKDSPSCVCYSSHFNNLCSRNQICITNLTGRYQCGSYFTKGLRHLR